MKEIKRWFDPDKWDMGYLTPVVTEGCVLGDGSTLHRLASVVSSPLLKDLEITDSMFPIDAFASRDRVESAPISRYNLPPN